MIKSELIQIIADENPHLFQRDVELIVSTVFDEIIDAMANGNRVELRGFGAFSVKKREARVGRNPRTGESVKVDAKYVLSLLSERAYAFHQTSNLGNYPCWDRAGCGGQQ